MSIFTGKQHKGAMREHRAAKKSEAVRRNARNLSIVSECHHRTGIDVGEHLVRCGSAQ